MANPRRKTGKKREKRNVPEGIAHIQSTFNNTIVTITDLTGNVISWASSGMTASRSWSWRPIERQPYPSWGAFATRR